MRTIVALGWTDRQWGIAAARMGRQPKTLTEVLQLRLDYLKQYRVEPPTEFMVYVRGVNADIREIDWDVVEDILLAIPFHLWQTSLQPLS